MKSNLGLFVACALIIFQSTGLRVCRTHSLTTISLKLQLQWRAHFYKNGKQCKIIKKKRFTYKCALTIFSGDQVGVLLINPKYGTFYKQASKQASKQKASKQVIIKN